jgi:hypothetical protein
MILINGSTVTELANEYGVKRDGEVVDFGPDELRAAIEVSVFGGEIQVRRVYATEWAVSPKQPEVIPGDDQIGDGS